MRVEWYVVRPREFEKDIVEKLRGSKISVIKTNKGYVVVGDKTIGVIKYECPYFLKDLFKAFNELANSISKYGDKELEKRLDEFEFQLSRLLDATISMLLSDIKYKCGQDTITINIITGNEEVAERLAELLGMPEKYEL
ncbi:MAG: hypothetical protein QXT27_08250 [Pyrobaculum sp.]